MEEKYKTLDAVDDGQINLDEESKRQLYAEIGKFVKAAHYDFDNINEEFDDFYE